MKGPRTSLLRGLIMQLFAFIVLPLTLLLLIIAFTSVFRHQQDMRALVGDRDERAVRSAASALNAELHHLESNISNLVALGGTLKHTEGYPSAIYRGERIHFAHKPVYVLLSNSPTGL